MAFTPKDWQNTPSATTPLSATALEDLETRVTDYADDLSDALSADIAVINEFLNVKNYGCAGDGTTDDTTDFQAALDAAAGATTGGKVVAPPGNYLLDGEINFDQNVAFEGAGERECILTLNDGGSYLHFNEPGAETNSRGGKVSGFHVDGNNAALVCIHSHKSVNRSFSNFRVSRPAGIGLLVDASQNCNFENFDVEATNALTTGIKVTDSAGSCRFAKFSIVGGDYAGIWVTQDNAGGQEGIGYPEPRYCTFDNAIVEHGDPSTACAMRIHSGRDIMVTRSQLMVATDVPSSGPYVIIEINDSGEGTVNQIHFDKCSVHGGADPQKDSTGFEISGGTNAYVRIRDINFGNNTIGIDADTGQQVECLSYRGPSTDTMFAGAGTIARRAFGATSITTS